MADDVPITAGSGTAVATDDVGGRHVQWFKQATGDLDSIEPIGDRDLGASRALFVDPRPNVVTQSQDSSGLTTSATAYSIGDTVGAGMTFTGMARANGGTGRIVGLALLDDGDVLSGLDLYIASASITFGTDNAAPSVTDADAAKIVATVGVNVADLGANRFGSTHSLAVPYLCDATSLFVYATTRSANAFFVAADDLHLRLFVELD